MSKTIKYVLLGLLGALVLIQLFPANKTNPPVSAGQDFLTLTSPDAEMAGLIKSACYDCHSHETNYPLLEPGANLTFLHLYISTILLLSTLTFSRSPNRRKASSSFSLLNTRSPF